MTEVTVDFEGYPEIELDDLLRLDEPCTIFEGEHIDSDGVVTYLYTVGGFLRGEPIVVPDHATRSVHGCLVGGDAILVQAENRAAADAMATDGLQHTIAQHRSHLLKEAVDRRANAGIIITSEMRPKRG